MPTVTTFESREAKLSKEINAQVDQILKRNPMTLPDKSSHIAECFVQKIEGTYNVDRAKKDTDNAIDLLYIAYNTTPQEEGAIRVKISGIMDGLLKAQLKSERTMARAMRIADTVLEELKNYLPDWLDVKEANSEVEIKNFVKSDLLSLTNDIKAQALSIKEELSAVAESYDAIITETAAATATSELALGKRKDAQDKMAKEINEAEAERDRIESLVTDLKIDVAKFDKLARDYESRAQTAEDRAFVMSIVRVGAQMLSAAIPAVAMASSGPGSVLAASSMGRTKQAIDDSGDDSGSTSKSDTKKDNTAEVIKTRNDISNKAAALEKSTKKVAELKTKKADLKKDLEEEAKKNPKKSAIQKKPEITTDTKVTKITKIDKDEDDVVRADDSEGEKGLKERIKTTQDELTKEEAEVSKLGVALEGLRASLNALDKGLGALSDEQQTQAGNLRTMQMKMLDKVEAFEKERRDQSAQLVKISALLKGKRTQEETIQLCIKSLNLSVTALKRAKEIIEEIAFFFKSFADFMQTVAGEATLQAAYLERAAATEQLRRNSLQNLLNSVDVFFIKQAGEWSATHTVSDKFNRSFSSGWSKLNKLSGKYITGDELSAYMKTASDQLEEIVQERDQAAKQKIIELDYYRQQLRGSAVG